jgi:hypothetical protein
VIIIRAGIKISYSKPTAPSIQVLSWLLRHKSWKMKIRNRAPFLPSSRLGCVGRFFIFCIDITKRHNIHTLQLPPCKLKVLFVELHHTMPAKTATNRSTSQQAMRGEESSPPPQNAITLSFNGVDFRLVPTDASSNGSISLSSTNGAYTMNLESFTGSLVVLSSPTEAAALGVTPSSVLSNAESSARTVEDEPPSPDSYSNKGELVLEQGQKQLPFERATSKKRVSSECTWIWILYRSFTWNVKCVICQIPSKHVHVLMLMIRCILFSTESFQRGTKVKEAMQFIRIRERCSSNTWPIVPNDTGNIRK